MREIKFRAWDIKENKRIHCYNQSIVGSNFDEFTWSLTPENSNVIFEQYTGLKDVNGKEIYEGDLYVIGEDNDNFKVVEITKTEHTSYGHGDCYTTYGIGFSYGSYGTNPKIKVVGNIHDELYQRILENKK